MVSKLPPAAIVILASVGWIATPAHAAGCLKGAAVGAVAGHVAGHHGTLGAGAGCVVGHHEAGKAAKKAQQPNESSTNNQGNSNAGH